MPTLLSSGRAGLTDPMEERLELSASPIAPGYPPVVTIENFSCDPTALRKQAGRSPFFPAKEFYPGLRAEIPETYWSESEPIISEVLAEFFGELGSINLIDISFSMVTTPPQDLSVLQRIPHCDAFNSRQFALIHFLSRDLTNGTAFYRQRSTGFVTLDEEKREIFFHYLEQDCAEYGLPRASYITGNTKMFEKLLEIDARFNRALIYPGNALHSGIIPESARLSTDPVDGRLTITAFFTVSQRPQ